MTEPIIGIEPMCNKCGYVGIERRVDIPGAFEKSILLFRIHLALFILLIPSLIGLISIVVDGYSPFWLLLFLLHFVIMYLAGRASDRIKTSNYYCANCGVPYNLPDDAKLPEASGGDIGEKK